jgi:hypothetical protein
MRERRPAHDSRRGGCGAAGWRWKEVMGQFEWAGHGQTGEAPDGLHDRKSRKRKMANGWAGKG